MKGFLLVFFLGFSIFSISQNVLISDQNNPNEPTITFDPLHPEKVMAACNIFHYFTSENGGLSWKSHDLKSPYGVWGDPVLDVDSDGNFYFFHLSNPKKGSWIDRIVCQKTSDFGKSWTEGTFAGLEGSKAQDKHWSAMDRSSKTIYLTWTQFDKYGSDVPTDSSSIMFSKSTDHGDSWSKAMRINEINGNCKDDDNTTEGAVPTVGPDGQIYVAWAGPAGLTFDRSEDGGKTWLDNDIHVDDMPTGWDCTIPGLGRANGMPITKCDTTGGKHNSTIYINWTDQRNGSNNTDIWLAKSSNQGNTWSAPIKVNGDITRTHQFFTWMDIDQTNGDLYFIYYDRSKYSDNQTDVVVAKSTDGGLSFSYETISESPFIPNANKFFGDYNNIKVYGGIVRPIWTRMDNGKLSIWTHVY